MRAGHASMYIHINLAAVYSVLDGSALQSSSGLQDVIVPGPSKIVILLRWKISLFFVPLEEQAQAS